MGTCFRIARFAADRRHSLGLVLFSLLLLCATVALLHPDAVLVYRTFKQAAPVNVTDSSGYMAHTICYGTLAAAAVVLLPTFWRFRALLLLLAHGVTSELLQRGIAGRTFDLADMACNVTAASVSFVLALTTVRFVNLSKSVNEEGLWSSRSRSTAAA